MYVQISIATLLAKIIDNYYNLEQLGIILYQYFVTYQVVLVSLNSCCPFSVWRVDIVTVSREYMDSLI